VSSQIIIIYFIDFNYKFLINFEKRSKASLKCNFIKVRFAESIARVLLLQYYKRKNDISY
jgi:hypothetical protein